MSATATREPLARTSAPTPSFPRLTHRLAWTTTLVTFVGIALGGLVTSTETGMADEHAPLFDGGWIPDFAAMARDPGLLLEHGHRIVMGTVGLLALLCAVAAWIRPGSSALLRAASGSPAGLEQDATLEKSATVDHSGAGTASQDRPRRWVRFLGVLVFVLVLPPAVFGALTVLETLHPAFSVTHVGFAMLFLFAVTSLSVVTGPGWYRAATDPAPDREKIGSLAALAVTNAVFVWVQIVLGAVPRHATAEHGGASQVAIGNAVHIIWAFLLFTVGILLAGRVIGSFSRNQRLVRPAVAFLLLLLLQVFLGFAAFISQPKSPSAVVIEAGNLVATGGHVVFASVHQAVGVLVWIVSTILMWRALRLRALARGSETPEAA